MLAGWLPVMDEAAIVTAVALAFACGGPAAPASSAESAPAGMGSPHPFLLREASFAHGWVVGCQSRLDTNHDGRVDLFIGRGGEFIGDEPEMFLFRGPGWGERIREYYDRSPGGRYVAIHRGGPLLIDAVAGTELDLRPHGAERAVAVSSRRQVAFVREVEGVSEAVVLDLGTLAPRVVHRVEKPSILEDEEPPEKIGRELQCLQDGRRVVARASDGALLAARGEFVNVQIGPVE